MLTLRVYVSELILAFLLSAVTTRGIGMLEGIVIVCALLYMILDIRAELRDLAQLEARVSSLSR